MLSSTAQNRNFKKTTVSKQFRSRSSSERNCSKFVAEGHSNASDLAIDRKSYVGYYSGPEDDNAQYE